MRILLPVLGVLAVSPACKKTVKAEAFEKTLAQQVTAMGLAPGKISCPRGVEAKEGASFTCQVEIETTTYDLIVTIEKVEGTSGNLDTRWARGDAVIAKKVTAGLKTDFEQRLGTTLEVTCGDEPLLFLDAERRVSCTIEAGATAAKVRIAFDDKLAATDFKLDPPLVARQKLEEILTPSVQEKTGPATKVACGTDPLLARPTDGTVWCDISDGKQAAKIRVSVTPALDVERWEVAQPE